MSLFFQDQPKQKRPQRVDDLLDAGLMSRIGQLDIVSRKIFAGKPQGERRSKRRGQSVEFADFRQTQLRTHAELLARDGSGCKLMIWQEPRKISLAHAGCERRCTAGIYEDVYPVMFDPGTGGCASLQ